MKTRIALRAIALVLVMAACMSGVTMDATTLLRLNLDQLAGAADAVARVRCIESIAYAEQGSVWTRSEFTVVEELKGALPARLAVRLPGGRSGGIVVSIEAVPRFRVGEDGVLFLEKLPTGDYSVTGWALGAFRIRRNERTGEEIITQDSSALAVFDPSSRRFVTEGIRELPLREFRRRLAVAFEKATAEAGKR